MPCAARQPGNWFLDALRFKDNTTALALSRELAQPTNAFFSDKMVRLDVLRDTKNAGLDAAIGQFEHEAADNPAKISQMAGWLMSRTTPAAALTWLHSLPKASQTNQPAALIIGQCQITEQDWAGLQSSLTNQNWAELEFIRHAYLARSLRGQKLDGASKAEWDLAVKYANPQKSYLIQLFQLAAGWNWVDEAEEILWTIVNRYPDEGWAADGFTAGLDPGWPHPPAVAIIRHPGKAVPQ